MFSHFFSIHEGFVKRGIEEIVRSEVIAAANSRASKASAGDRRAGAVSGFLLSESWSHGVMESWSSW